MTGFDHEWVCQRNDWVLHHHSPETAEMQSPIAMHNIRGLQRHVLLLILLNNFLSLPGIEREKHIPKIWPLFAEHEDDKTKIRHLNHTGTHPVHTDLTINDSMDYLEMIGLERKENRMRFIQRYWSDALRDVKNVVINTPKEPHRSCGIANVGVNTMKPHDLAKTLLDEFKIWTVAIDYANVKGCRITPNVYTTTEELDHFVDAIKTLAKRG